MNDDLYHGMDGMEAAKLRDFEMEEEALLEPEPKDVTVTYTPEEAALLSKMITYLIVTGDSIPSQEFKLLLAINQKLIQ